MRRQSRGSCAACISAAEPGAVQRPAEAVHGVDVPIRDVLLTLAYAACYVAVLLVGAIAIFRRRDFK